MTSHAFQTRIRQRLDTLSGPDGLSRSFVVNGAANRTCSGTKGQKRLTRSGRLAQDFPVRYDAADQIILAERRTQRETLRAAFRAKPFSMKLLSRLNHADETIDTQLPLSPRGQKLFSSVGASGVLISPARHDTGLRRSARTDDVIWAIGETLRRSRYATFTREHLCLTLEIRQQDIDRAVTELLKRHLIRCSNRRHQEFTYSVRSYNLTDAGHRSFGIAVP